MTTGGRLPGIFGPEPWKEVAGQAWCHFDWWFALVAVAECEGDLEALRERLEQQHRGSLRRNAPGRTTSGAERLPARP